MTCQYAEKCASGIGTAVTTHGGGLPYSGLNVATLGTIGAMLLVIGTILLIGTRSAR